MFIWLLARLALPQKKSLRSSLRELPIVSLHRWAASMSTRLTDGYWEAIFVLAQKSGEDRTKERGVFLLFFSKGIIRLGKNRCGRFSSFPSEMPRDSEKMLLDFFVNFRVTNQTDDGILLSIFIQFWEKPKKRGTASLKLSSFPGRAIADQFSSFSSETPRDVRKMLTGFLVDLSVTKKIDHGTLQGV